MKAISDILNPISTFHLLLIQKINTMKTIKNLSVLFMAIMFAISVSAQGTAASGTKASTGTNQLPVPNPLPVPRLLPVQKPWTKLMPAKKAPMAKRFTPVQKAAATIWIKAAIRNIFLKKPINLCLSHYKKSPPGNGGDFLFHPGHIKFRAPAAIEAFKGV